MHSKKTKQKETDFAIGPMCYDCGVDMISRREHLETGYNVYMECPKCHKQWIFECDTKGRVLAVKD